MADTWYYAKGTTRQGPVTLEQLRALIASNQVLMSDNVWREGMANWAPASTCPELGHPVVAPQAPPVPLMPPPTPAYNAPAAPPAYGGPPAYAPPASPSIPLSQRPEVWNKNQRTMRIMLIVAAGIAFVTFFTPQFYMLLRTQYTGVSRLLWGWSTWFGITVFVLSIFALAAAIVDLLLRKIPLIPFIMQWVHLGLFGIMGIMMLLGTILGIFGIGTTGGWFYCIPITSILAVLGLALGVTISIMIVLKHRPRMA